MSKKSDYRVPATCRVCNRKFLARYNTGSRAKVCTPPTHKCKIEMKNGRKVPCVDKCCRSKYARGASQASLDGAIDPRYVLSDEEFKKMWKALESLRDPEGITLRFIAKTGCRLEESRLVRPEDLRWASGAFSVVIVHTIKRAGRPPRQVHLRNADLFVADLRKWVKAAKPNELLFPVARRTLQRALERILDTIKPDRSALVHLLRHTRASQIIAAGGDWNYLRSQLGWASLEMAKRYVHTDSDTIAEVLGKI
jgi:integrase